MTSGPDPLLHPEWAEGLPDGVLIADPAGRLQAWNPAVHHLFHTLPGTLPTDLHLDDLVAPRAREEFARALTANRGCGEWPSPRSEGAELMLEWTFGRGPGGGLLAVVRDVTARVREEESLRRTVTLFGRIHAHLVDLIAIVDSRGQRRYSSPSYAGVLGYSQEEMAHLGSLELLHPDDQGKIAAALDHLMKGRPMQGLQYRLRHRDGRWLHFESTASLIAGTEDGEPQALIVARDRTEHVEFERRRLEMEAQLRQAQKLEAIGQLAAGIAHEINTPIQYIGDNATFLRDSFEAVFSHLTRALAHLSSIRSAGGPAGENAARALGELQSADLGYLEAEIPSALQQTLDGVARISRIVNAMKDFSHPGSDAKLPTDLQRAIESTVTVSRNEWKYVANLAERFDPELPPVPCFPDEINQVVLNLIINAAHAIETARAHRPPGWMGTITVTTARKGDEAEVSVGDDGTGIPDGIRDRIFEPFFTTKPVGKGTGQGLAMAYKVVVDQHGGRIEVDTAPGQGSTFRLFLPLS